MVKYIFKKMAFLSWLQRPGKNIIFGLLFPKSSCRLQVLKKGKNSHTRLFLYKKSFYKKTRLKFLPLKNRLLFKTKEKIRKSQA